MIKKIKESINDCKIKKLNGIIAKQQEQINQLQTQVMQDQVTIGQWQNKLYSVQMQYDALRLSQATILEPFKNLFIQETQVFMEANKTWVDKINSLDVRIKELVFINEEQDNKIQQLINNNDKK